MIETDFMGFLVLLTISVMVSAILHYGLKFYVTQGLSSFFFKVAIGWVGAWLGSKVLGQWWEGLNYGQIYYFPAILGCLAFALLVFPVDLAKTFDDAPNRRA
jgi:uncharacterized membrane protein YeaQ/YmgE (transglycosylase-associated protein family)